MSTEVLSQKHLLVVEDYYDLQDYYVDVFVRITRMLDAEQIMLADNAKDAVRLANKHKPSASIINLTLSGGESGYDLIKYFRQRSRFRDMPIFVVSATDKTEVINACEKLGINEYFIKPDIARLPSSVVNSLLAKR